METISTKEVASALNSSEYPLDIPANIERRAKESGIVIVYGASDDLMEFAGAIYDEVGVYDGGDAFVDREGLIPVYDSIDKDDKELVRDCLRREGNGKKIEALWNAGDNYSWVYRTDIPHETFEVVEDGAPYCRGIVFRLSDCA